MKNEVTIAPFHATCKDGSRIYSVETHLKHAEVCVILDHKRWLKSTLLLIIREERVYSLYYQGGARVLPILSGRSGCTPYIIREERVYSLYYQGGARVLPILSGRSGCTPYIIREERVYSLYYQGGAGVLPILSGRSACTPYIIREERVYSLYYQGGARVLPILSGRSACTPYIIREERVYSLYWIIPLFKMADQNSPKTNFATAHSKPAVQKQYLSIKKRGEGGNLKFIKRRCVFLCFCFPVA